MRAALATAMLLAAVPALAQDKPDGSDGPRFCPTRPSLGGSSCTTEPGHVQIEASTFDWQRDDRSDQREDRIVSADLLARFGVGPKTEVQVGWTAYGHDRTRDKTTGEIDTVNGTGDVTLAVRQHLAGEEGKPFSAGFQPFVTVPTGRYPVGAGDWSAGAQVPVQYDLTRKLAAQFTGEMDAATNQSGDGRHLAYSGIWGLRYKLTEAVNVYGELSVERDDDPSGHETHSLAAFSVAWRPTKRFQLDAQVVAGLNPNSPDIRLVTGGAIVF
ncbi:transporter [Sphingomonas bacterium]|uniref:transporter n=1 Tax=Sphingomonas bacterium TaxID=1895847 RepID=UPI001577650F|nr:transporter [Sphingomonas bacterium]